MSAPLRCGVCIYTGFYLCDGSKTLINLNIMEALSSSFLATSPSLRFREHKHLHAITRCTISAVQTEERLAGSQKKKKQQPTNTTAAPGRHSVDQSAGNEAVLPRMVTTPRRKTTTKVMRPSLAVTLCNALDALIDNFFYPRVLHPSIDPRRVLRGNWYPVDELPPTPCPVVRGAIPRCLAGGAYIRNGPNPQYLPDGPYHLFDGDGMLHSLLLPAAGSTAPATFSSRYVRTYKFNVEREAGGPLFPHVFAGFRGVGAIARSAVSVIRVLTGQMNPANGIGLANTSLLFFAGQLYALAESDLPYAVHLSRSTGNIATIGRCDFDGKLFMAMTAHPKQDPVTGELFSFRFSPMPPYVTYFQFDSDGKKGPDVPVLSYTQPSFIHDFAITEQYAIFPDIQLVMQLKEMLVGGGSLVGVDKRKVPRLGLLPRHPTPESEMRWFEVPGFNVTHTLNAWEEDGGETVVLVAPNVLSIEHTLESMELIHCRVEMVRINLRTGTVTRTPMSELNLDFGMINPQYVGRKNRYAFLGIGDPMPNIRGVVKLDFEMAGRGDCEVARREFGPGCVAGEPFFVSSGEGGGEDDGYVVCYVHNGGRGESSFVVMDAKSPELEVVAEVLLPRRVPCGFHGLFISGEEIEAQRRSRG